MNKTGHGTGERHCFVIMPFREDFQSVYSTVIKPILESPPLEVSCSRVDEIFTPTSIIEDITRSIRRSDFLIADLTGKNPNVLYELGFAHGIQKNAILLTQDIEDVPFDLRHLRLAVYKDNAAGLHQLRESLLTTVPELMNDLQLPEAAEPLTLSPSLSASDEELVSLERELDSLRSAFDFLKDTGRPVESIRTYDDLREACLGKGHGPETRWHLTNRYLDALRTPIPKETVRNVLVPMAFLAGRNEVHKARLLLVQQDVSGPFELRPEWIDNERQYRQQLATKLREEIVTTQEALESG